MGAMSSRPITSEEPTASQQQQRQQQRQRQQRQHQLGEATGEGTKPATLPSVPPAPFPEGHPSPAADAAGENPEGVEGTPSNPGHVGPSSFSSAALSTASSASLSRGAAAAAARKEPTPGASPACKKPVLREHRKGKGKVKGLVVAKKSGGKVGGGGGAGGGGGGGSGSGAKAAAAAAAKIAGDRKKTSGFGQGKRPRAGQSHKRARKDETSDEVRGQHRFVTFTSEGGRGSGVPIPRSVLLYSCFFAAFEECLVSREPCGLLPDRGGRAGGPPSGVRLLPCLAVDRFGFGVVGFGPDFYIFGCFRPF